MSRDTLTNFRAEDFKGSKKSARKKGSPKRDEAAKEGMPRATDEEKGITQQEEPAKKAAAKKAPAKKAADKK